MGVFEGVGIFESVAKCPIERAVPEDNGTDDKKNLVPEKYSSY